MTRLSVPQSPPLNRPLTDSARREPSAAKRAVRHALLNSPGAPLDHAELKAASPGVAADFSQVRVHRDVHANRAAAELRTPAYTVGQHVFIRDDLPRLDTDLGRRVLAHELTHTRQQPRLPDRMTEADTSVLPLPRLPRAHGTEEEAWRHERLATRQPHLQRASGRLGPVTALAAPAIQCFDIPLDGWSPSERSLGGFLADLTTNDDSSMSVDMAWKVFNDRGQLTHDGDFSNRRDRGSISLAPGTYELQILGDVNVLKDTFPDMTNHWRIIATWRVMVDAAGTFTFRTAGGLDLSGGAGDAPWQLAADQLNGADTLALHLALSSTETAGSSDSSGESLSLEFAGEPGGMGVAGGSSSESSHTSERGSSFTGIEAFDLGLDLYASIPAPAAVPELGPVRLETADAVTFRSGAADFSGEQRDELVRRFFALDANPELGRARGTGLRILIEGYASERGSSDDNRELSRRRAEFVAAIARSTLPGADVPTPGYVGEAMWTDTSAPDDDIADHRVARYRVVDNRASLTD